MNNDVFAERVRNKSTEKNPGSSWDQTQDLLNISQTLVQLSHLEDKLRKQHCLETSTEL